MSKFTGLVEMTTVQRNRMLAGCIDYDFEKMVCGADEMKSLGIMDLMIAHGIREDQWQMNSCTGFGMAHVASVMFWLATGTWRQFNPHWCYRNAQLIDGIRGDNGATIDGVTEAAMRDGLLPQDVENDGVKEFPFLKNQYNATYPASARQLAAKRKVGYKVHLKTWQAMMNFLISGQGGIVVGGPWGNWSPDASGVCRRFAAGGGGHCRGRVDIKQINGEWVIVEPNSHFENYGDRGFGYITQEFAEAELRSSQFVAIGVSDLKLAPGDKPTPRKRRFVNFTGKA